uniref:Uncharacterized protein n=1 Tax=Arundo donax TaxID=35708 RepID=A0A0A9I347_ARUDO
MGRRRSAISILKGIAVRNLNRGRRRWRRRELGGVVVVEAETDDAGMDSAKQRASTGEEHDMEHTEDDLGFLNYPCLQ